MEAVDTWGFFSLYQNGSLQGKATVSEWAQR